MIQYRPFLNHDPPAIAEIWRSQLPQRGLAQPMSPLLFEQFVLGKNYFDRFGLILAVDHDRAVGFAHAGLGPRDDLRAPGRERGATCLVLVSPRPDRTQIAAELLAKSEAYLRERGAKILFGGATERADPFYLGLYGGSRQFGILTSDEPSVELFRSAGYREQRKSLVLSRNLAGFRPVVDRKQMQLRRQFQIETIHDVLPENWWEACVWGETARTRFNLCDRTKGGASGHLTFWDVQPIASTWGVHAAGLSQLEVSTIVRRQGLATFILGEALRQLQTQGVTVVEVQIHEDNLPALGLYQKLGFEHIDTAIEFARPA